MTGCPAIVGARGRGGRGDGGAVAERGRGAGLDGRTDHGARRRGLRRGRPRRPRSGADLRPRGLGRAGAAPQGERGGGSGAHRRLPAGRERVRPRRRLPDPRPAPHSHPRHRRTLDPHPPRPHRRHRRPPPPEARPRHLPPPHGRPRHRLGARRPSRRFHRRGAGRGVVPGEVQRRHQRGLDPAVAGRRAECPRQAGVQRQPRLGQRTRRRRRPRRGRAARTGRPAGLRPQHPHPAQGGARARRRHQPRPAVPWARHLPGERRGRLLRPRRRHRRGRPRPAGRAPGRHAVRTVRLGQVLPGSGRSGAPDAASRVRRAGGERRAHRLPPGRDRHRVVRADAFRAVRAARPGFQRRPGRDLARLARPRRHPPPGHGQLVRQAPDRSRPGRGTPRPHRGRTRPGRRPALSRTPRTGLARPAHPALRLHGRDAQTPAPGPRAARRLPPSR